MLKAARIVGVLLVFADGLIGAGGSLTEARRRATVNPDLVFLKAVDFSAALRE